MQLIIYFDMFSSCCFFVVNDSCIITHTDLRFLFSKKGGGGKWEISEC